MPSSITFPSGITIGAAVIGGGANRVLFEDASQNVQADVDMQFNGTQLQLATTGATGGVLIGGDAQIYRSAADTLLTPDALIVNGLMSSVGSGGTSNPGSQFWASGSDGSNATAAIRQNGAGDILVLFAGSAERQRTTNAGQLQLLTTGSGGGVLIGGDAQIYRSAADVLTTPDSFISIGSLNSIASGGGANPGGRQLWVSDNSGNAAVGFNQVGVGDLLVLSVGASERIRVTNAGLLQLAVNNSLAFTNQTSAAGAQVATMTNGPVAGNPAFWARCIVNGTNSFVPMWQ